MAELQRDPSKGRFPPNADAGDWHGTGRRMSDHKMQAIADSALLKVMQYAITGVAVPVMLWFGNSTLARLEKIETTTAVAAIQNATFEQRLKQLESSGYERQAAINLLRDQVLRHDFEIRRMAEERARAMQGR
jgi:cell division protein FtsB